MRQVSVFQWLLLPLLCKGEGGLDFTHNPAIWAYSQDPTYWLYNQDQAILGYSHDSADMGYSQNWPVLGYSQTQEHQHSYPGANIHHLPGSYPQYTPGPTGFHLPVVSEREVVLPPLHAPAPLPVPPLKVGGSHARGAEQLQHPVIGTVRQLPPPASLLPNLASPTHHPAHRSHTRPAIGNPFQPAVPHTAAGSVPRPAVHHLPAVPGASPGCSEGDQARLMVKSRWRVGSSQSRSCSASAHSTWKRGLFTIPRAG